MPHLPPPLAVQPLEPVHQIYRVRQSVPETIRAIHPRQ